MDKSDDGKQQSTKPKVLLHSIDTTLLFSFQSSSYCQVSRKLSTSFFIANIKRLQDKCMQNEIFLPVHCLKITQFSAFE